MDAYKPLLDRTRVPHPSLQRYAVIQLFNHLRSAEPQSVPDSDPAREVITRVLHSSPAVVDQSVRELCRLVKDSKLELSFGLLELQSALEGSDPVLVDVFVRGIGFLVRVGFRDKRLKIPEGTENHPFVKVLSCRAEVQNELVQQVLLFVSHSKHVGMDDVCDYLRPFLNYSILRIPFSDSSAAVFARSLMSSMTSLCCSFPPEAVSIFEMLISCLRYFPTRSSEDIMNFLNIAEVLVDAHIVVLRNAVRMSSIVHEVRLSMVKLLDTLLLLCLDFGKNSAGVVAILELSRRLLSVQEELGLHYVSELFSPMLSMFVILTRLELEHEQLCILGLLSFLLNWKIEYDLVGGAVACNLSEALLFIFPVVNLMSSPSKSVKGAATEVLLVMQKFLLNFLTLPESELYVQREFQSASKLGVIVFRLLQHLWLQDSSSITFFLNITSTSGNDVKEVENASKFWISQLQEYALRIVETNKFSPHISQSREVILAEMPLLLSSLVGVLVLHNYLGKPAVEALAALGNMEPKLDVMLLLAILYYCNLLRSKHLCSYDMLLKLLEMLPSLASHSAMTPLIVQTILPMLRKDAKPELYATAVRLLCKTWENNDRIFGNLQGILLPEKFADFICERTISMSMAASLRDVCRRNPDRGVELILSVAACIESHDPIIQVFGFQGLGHLCEADVVDFYTAWDVISKHVLDYSTDPTVAYGLCSLLRWGAMDAEAYSESSKNVLQILWKVGSSNYPTGETQWKKARASALDALNGFEVAQIEKSIQDFKGNAWELLIHETDPDILGVIVELEANIIAYEHSTRRRFIKEKRVSGNKVEKLLDVFPEVIFSSGRSAKDLPGAALLCLPLNPKDVSYQRRSKDVLGHYDGVLKAIAASLPLLRNIFVAVLSLESWKWFMQRWMKAYITFLDLKASSTALVKTSKAANEILKKIMQIGEDSIPRVAENIALAVGALCMVVPASVHSVKATASKFLLNWLFQCEHEHRQWTAAISLGVITSCLHVTDRKQKLQNISGLIEVTSSSRNSLVIGACGMGLGYSCQDLLTRAVSAENTSDDTFDHEEAELLGQIIRTLSLMMCQLTQFSSELLQSLSHYAHPGLHSQSGMTSEPVNRSCEDLEEDIWGVAGLILGLGISVTALFRAGSHDAICNIKLFLTSCIEQANAPVEKPAYGAGNPYILLSIGACLALPIVVSFCQRVELMHDSELDHLVICYEQLISRLLLVRTSSTFHQNLLMASCVGAGSLLACILDGGVHSLQVEHVKELLELFRKSYSSPYPHIIHLGGMLGVVNAMGAGAGTRVHQVDSSSCVQTVYEKKGSSRIMGPLLSNPAFELDLTSLIQDIFLVTQNSDDNQLQQHAAWALSFLRHHMWSKGKSNNSSHNSEVVSTNPLSQSFSEDSTVMKLSLWLMHLDYAETSRIAHINTVTAVLNCLSRAPRLPSLDWGAVVRRCMRYEAHVTKLLPQDSCHEKGTLRVESLQFSLAHANKFDSLLAFVDELSDLPRFRSLDMNLQSCLLSHLLDLMKLFSSSRVEKLFKDITEYFSSPISSYQTYNKFERGLLRISFWGGLFNCLGDASVDMSDYISSMEKCMELLFSLLPRVPPTAISEQDNVPCLKERDVSMKCLARAPQAWLLDLLQVSEADLMGRDDQFTAVQKKLQARARLVRIGSLPLTELGKLKAYLLNTPSQGMWEVLTETVAALRQAEGSVKRQWLIDTLEISCITKYPSTALKFLGMLSGICCKYMPLLILEPSAVLSDLPVTLASVLSTSSWETIAESAVSYLWKSTERIYNWAMSLTRRIEQPNLQPIAESEAETADLLMRVTLDACVSLKDYLPLEKQLKLANMISY